MAPGVLPGGQWAFWGLWVLASSLDGLAGGLDVGQEGGSKGHALPGRGAGGLSTGDSWRHAPFAPASRGGGAPCHGGPDRRTSSWGRWARSGGAPSGAGARGGFRRGVLLAMPRRPRHRGGGPCRGGPDRMIWGTRQFARWADRRARRGTPSAAGRRRGVGREVPPGVPPPPQHRGGGGPCPGGPDRMASSWGRLPGLGARGPAVLRGGHP